ncbi:MAG: PAS domain-containing protein [Methanomicrobiales archaeon]|nr:PAS domain-containing protein [Methanomicrobiales archaeon]
MKMTSDSPPETLRVLYVDDEEFLLEPTKLFLEHFGDISLDTVNSGKKALDLMAEKKYDAIIADYEMHEINGIDLLKIIRSSGNHIPFIIFTGRGREEVVIEALNLGADFYLQKGHEVRAQYTELHAKIIQAVKQRQIEEKLMISEERLRLSIMATNQGLWDVDIEKGRISASEEFFHLFGYEKDEILPTYDWWISMIHPDDSEHVKQVYQNYISKKVDKFSLEFRFRTKQGKWKWIMSRGKILSYDKNGNPLRMIGTHIDITEQVEAENMLFQKHEELQKSYDQIAQSEEELRQSEKDRTLALSQVRKNFAELSILNDGIRNPLTVIVAQTELKCPEIADIVISQAKEIDELITQLDRRWIESEKVINYIRKHHGIEYSDKPDTD